MPGRIQQLFRHLVIYGLGDAATSLVSLLLLPVFTRYLTPADYGVIAMLLTMEALTKVVFRWGVDTAFMRLYYDCRDQASRQRLASTIFLFLLAVNGSLAIIGILSAAWLSRQLFGVDGHAILIALTIANTFVAGFYFIPYQVLRIGEHSKQFIALTFTRSAATVVARLVLVVAGGMGVRGIVLADVIVTAVFTTLLIRWFAPLLRPMFSREVLHEALTFGLPRIPHSLASQVIGFADRYFLNAFAALRDVGIYSIGASFGLALKLFLSAFESAWTPFFLGVMHDQDAKQIYRVASTYVVAVLVLLVATLCAVAPDLVRLFTTAEFHGAAVVTPWIALGVLFQGLYLVGSIGLVITKRTRFYPLATGSAAAACVLANALLVPRFGMLGAAWATTSAYATLAAVTVGFSWRVYPISYEWHRLVRVALAGLVAYLAGRSLEAASWPALAILIVRGALAATVYAAALAVTGFFHAGELEALRRVRQLALRQKIDPTSVPQSVQAESAGEIVATGLEPPLSALEPDHAIRSASPTSGDSRSRPR